MQYRASFLPRNRRERQTFHGFAIGVEVVTLCAEGSSREVVEMRMPTIRQITNAARCLVEDQRVPYAFEQRIMAHLRSAKVADLWSAWSGTMWRAAFSCLLISALTGAAVMVADPSRAELFASDLERTVLAPVDVDDSW